MEEAKRRLEERMRAMEMEMAREGNVAEIGDEAEADVNKAKNDGVTSLFATAHEGHEAVVRGLVEAGAEVNKAMDDGLTPLYVAAQRGYEAVVRGLLEAGAEVNKARDDARPLCTSPRKRVARLWCGGWWRRGRR